MKSFWVLILFVTFKAWGLDHDHTHFTNVLRDHVKLSGKQSLVDYKGIKSNPKELDLYIVELSKVTKAEFEAWSTEQKLAVLINGYNAWTIKLVTDHFPVTSIKKIGPFYSSPWKIKFIHWLGEEVSLDEIEHERIRSKFSEPRIHFALVCASIGCPSLQNVPFKSSTLDQQLNKALKEFLTDSSKNRFSIYDNQINLYISSIFEWYGKDFGDEAQLQKLLLKAMGLEDQAKGKKIKIEYLDYNWNLNEIK